MIHIFDIHYTIHDMYIYIFIYIYGILILVKVFLIKSISDKTDEQEINSHFNVIKNTYCLLNTSK